MTWNSAPSTGVVEVSLFGPGRGESCVIHLGNGEWVVVDSCVDQKTGGNSALTYLDRIGVAVEQQVRVVVATHAHDDHIAGISEVVERCEAAKFVIPAAASREEFMTLLEADSEVEMLVRPAIFSEYRKAFDTLQLRHGGRPQITRAIANRLLFSSEDGSAEVWSLCPSDESVTIALEHMRTLVVPGQTEKRRISPGDPNSFAAAIWIRVGDIRVLLGADVLSGPGPNCGWNAILSSTSRPPGKASLYKVAHHGSPTSQHEGIFTDLLEPGPISVLSPFRGSKTPRPSPNDEDWIRSRSAGAYATAPTRSSNTALKATRASLAGVARNVRETYGAPGQVRARRTTSESAWQVDLFPPAKSI